MNKAIVIVLIIVLFICQSKGQEPTNLTEYSIADLDSIGQLNYEEDKYELALVYTLESLKKKIQKYGEKDSLTATTWYQLGNVYGYGELNLDSAIICYQQAIAIQKDIDPLPLDYTNILYELGSLYTYMGAYQLAEPILLDACKIDKERLGPWSADYATLLGELGMVYLQLGKHEEAEPLLLQAVEILKISKDENQPILYYNALNKLGQLYYYTRQYAKAKPLFIEYKELSYEYFGPNSSDYIISMNNMAGLYQETKRYKQAEATFLEAKKLIKVNFGLNDPQYLLILQNLGTVYYKMKRYKEAEQLFLEAKALFNVNNVDGTSIYIYLLNNLADVYLQLEKFDTAFSFAMTALAYNSRTPSAAFSNLDADLSNQNIYTYTQKDSYKNLSVEDLENLSRLSYGNPTRVNLSFLHLVRAAKEQHKLLVRQKSTATEIAKQHERYYNLSKASMDYNERMRSELSGESNQLRILKQNTKFVELGLHAALTVDHTDYHQEAFGFAEQNKSILLANALIGAEARSFGDLPDSLVQYELELKERKSFLRKEKSALKNGSIPEELIHQENTLNQEMAAFLKALKGKYPKYHALKYKAVTASVSDVQAFLKEVNSRSNAPTMVLEYFVADTTVYLFALAEQSFKLFAFSIGKDKLAAQIKKLRKTLTDYRFVTKEPNRVYEMYTTTAYWFYETLVEPALVGHEIGNLIVITDGALGHLPFEAFLTEPPSQENNKITNANTDRYKLLPYLINDYTVGYNYSAALLLNSNRPKNTNASNSAFKSGQMLACAATYPGADSSWLKQRSPALFKLRKHLSPLPAAQKEVATLEKVFKGAFLNAYDPSANYSEEEAPDGNNRVASETFFKTHAPEYSIIHLAMHGILNEKAPLLSSLAFTEDQDSLEDNFLQAYEISNLKLNAELVVLSACETGYGTFQQGEGVLSLARSFMYAGVPSMVVSLWQVNDYSTSMIMQLFYQYLADGLPKDEALKQAKLNYIQTAKGILSHPAFWSPFIQLGNNNSIFIAKKKTSKLFWVGGGLFMIILAGVGWKKRKGSMKA